MIGFKGFDERLRCRDMQYELGKKYDHFDSVVICESGFHFCENPLDVLGYYEPATSRYAEIEADGVSPQTDGDSKRVASKLTIKAEIGLSGIIAAGVKFILERVNFKDATESNTGDRSAATNTGYSSAATNTGYRSAATNTADSSAATNTGDSSAATNTGYSSAATNTGYRSAATNTGYSSAATNTGDSSAATNTGDSSAATNTGYSSAATNTADRSAATNTGYSSAATNTGYSSAATNTGYRSAATNTGDSSAATNTGDRSAATNTGDSSAATNTGKEGCAISLGIDGRASGALGCWLTLAEWQQNAKGEWHRIDVQTRRVDGEQIKPEIFYILRGGKFIQFVDKAKESS